MGLNNELQDYVRKVLKDKWTTRDGLTVPNTEDVGLGNEAVLLEGTVLYADLAESTALVKGYRDRFAAEIYKSYLYCAAKIIRSHGGAITAYDGDRVMAVYIGDSKNTSAAKSALEINWVVGQVINPAIKNQYPKAGYSVKQKVGIDTSPLFVARTGIRGSNDLVWVGNSANNAAKMAALSAGYATYITGETYRTLHESAKCGGNPKRDMWTNLGTTHLGYQILGSNFGWSIS